MGEIHLQCFTTLLKLGVVPFVRALAGILLISCVVTHAVLILFTLLPFPKLSKGSKSITVIFTCTDLI